MSSENISITQKLSEKSENVIFYTEAVYCCLNSGCLLTLIKSAFVYKIYHQKILHFVVKRRLQWNTVCCANNKV